MDARVLLVLLLAACGSKADDDPAPELPEEDDCLEGEDIQAAIDAGDPEIRVCSGVHDVALRIEADVELSGAQGAVLSGQATGEPVVTVAASASVVLRDLTVADGVSATSAGGIDAGEAASLTLVGCSVLGNEGGPVGGVDGPAAGPLRLEGTLVEGNRGGAGGVRGFALKLVRSAVSDNDATAAGGGVLLRSGGSGDADGDSELAGNRSDALGGGLHLEPGATWTGGRIFGNTAQQRGGGVSASVMGATLVTGVTVEGNEALVSGGGIAVLPWAPGTFELEDAVLQGNIAPTGGGAHLIPGAHGMTLRDVRVEGNTSDNGGGVSVSGPDPSQSPIDLVTTALVGNVAAQSGGGLHLASDSVVGLEASEVSGNEAQVQGGGAAIQAGVLHSDGNTWGGAGGANLPHDIWMLGIVLATVEHDVFTCSAPLLECIY